MAYIFMDSGDGFDKRKIEHLKICNYISFSESRRPIEKVIENILKITSKIKRHILVVFMPQRKYQN
jgi:hypothetical protein